MDNIEVILWAILGIAAGLYWWIGKVYILRLQNDSHATFWNPIRARIAPLISEFGRILSTAGILLLIPQLGMLSVVIGGFSLTERGWWFLGAVVFLDIALSSITVAEK